MAPTFDISRRLAIVAEAIRDQQVPVVDLIAVQTKDPFKVLVATILSARTKDETTAGASKRLFALASSPEELSRLSVARIEQLIHPVGFFRNKARYLAALPEALAHFNGQVPDSLDELLSLPGVGRKTANLVLATAFTKPAICVDTHVHRIMNIWRYVDTTSPLATEMALRERLPRRHWLQVNSLLVAFGQAICKPVAPHCDRCPLTSDCAKHNVTPRKIPAAPSRPASKAAAGGRRLKLISWNVNGIRAIEKKGFSTTLTQLDADIVALQETKAQPDQIPDTLSSLPGYHCYWHSAEKKGYSGVGILSRVEPKRVLVGLDNPQFDREGRVLTLEFTDFFLVAIYFPNSGEALKRLDYKEQFNSALLDFANGLRQRKAVVLCGDFNVAHQPIDLANPESNSKNAGYTPEERRWMDTFLAAGYVDTFRAFNTEPHQYTWWSYRFNARARNIGWRIDYFLVAEEAMSRVGDAAILADIVGSDHCPVQLEFITSTP